MTAPGQPFLVDPGNPLLAMGPARMDAGTMDAPGGMLGVLTFRTSSATLTMLVSATDLRAWSRALSGLADQLGGALVVASPHDVMSLGKPPVQG